PAGSPPPTVIVTNISSTNPPATMFTNVNSTNPMAAPVSYLGAVGRGKETAIKEIDIAQINQAVQVFNVEHDRYPRDLQELVDSGDLKEIPRPPYGLVLLYDPDTGQVSFARR